jgi:pyruvate/2-oxoglutarate dehydrogenase complex dihydrolipoamide dehydrogenase (E3) component/uncharacterized membrane protein YdjX (TVP38/TMEM64 family)
VNRTHSVRIAAGTALVAALLLALLPPVRHWVSEQVFDPLRADLYRCLPWVQGLGLWGPAVLVIAYVLAAVLFIPGTLLTLVAGFLFGVPGGTATVSAGSTLGAAAAFLLGRTLARPWVQRRVAGKPRFAALDEAVRRQGFRIVLLVRLSPLFPYNLTNYAFGLTPVSFRDFVLASWIGMLPATVVYVYLGSTLQQLADVGAGSPEGGLARKLLFGVGLVATVLVLVVASRLARRALTEAVPAAAGASREGNTMSTADQVQVLPDDTYNRELVANVHPAGWTNPSPAPMYNLVVLGAGTAGLVTAAGAAGLGARVALVEKHLMGGDCLNVGCVPSKSLVRAARAAADVRDAERFGVRVPQGVAVDFPAVMERMRQARAHLSPHDSAQRFRDLGVDVFLGQGMFTGPDTVAVDGQVLRFRKAVIATGGRAAAPPVPGLAEAGYLTNETVFSLTKRPGRLAVIGAGPIGCELAQAFARFGCRVTLLEVLPHVLPREDRDAAGLVEAALKRDGVVIHVACKILGVERQGMEKVLRLEGAGVEPELRVDEVLVGAGRAANVDGLGLEAAGVAFDRGGVKVNDRLQTTNRRIYAAGDICSAYKFTHAADALARIVVQNALFLGRAKASALTMPWCTYTDPEVAHVGLYEQEARERGIAVQTFVQPLEGVDRAVLDNETDGFVKVHVRRGTDRIAGATVVARHAGETISELTLAIANRVGLRGLARTIHPYPTQAEAIKKVADAYNRTRLTPFVKGLFTRWLRWLR